ncbi:MAG: radical SAM protein [Deltaproteobacteria bacterium]|nr:radical SAM protein [Deltaproteobacteria bacterium]
MAELPYLVFADPQGRIYEHPFFRMAAFSGNRPVPLAPSDLIPMPEYSKLFYLPDCPAIGLDPETGRVRVIPETEVEGRKTPCLAVAAFPEPGLVRTHLPAADYRAKKYTLPMWGYTAVGFKRGRYRIAAFRVEDNPRWDPRNYDDRALIPAIQAYRKKQPLGPLVRHLLGCAVDNHCFAAKNLFLQRWEAPLPVSRRCNARCLGCLSLQKEGTCVASQQRLAFKPDPEEIVSVAVRHLELAPEAVVSFGQGCEGEPLTEARLIAASIREIRRRTGKGTINLNTNGSLPDRVRQLADSGLDSIRISLNSARPPFYRAYYRPRGYDFNAVVDSIQAARDRGLFTMINYLVFPGITDQQAEIMSLIQLIGKTGLDFLHLKNLNIDPDLYLRSLPASRSPAAGLRAAVDRLRETFPGLRLGYFNQPKGGQDIIRT